MVISDWAKSVVLCHEARKGWKETQPRWLWGPRQTPRPLVLRGNEATGNQEQIFASILKSERKKQTNNKKQQQVQWTEFSIKLNLFHLKQCSLP